MIIEATLIENEMTIEADLGEVHNISDGGYERGHAEGYEAGHTEGYAEGSEEGLARGRAEGYAEGYAEGSVESTQFWDTFQQNGNRTDYNYAFAGAGWTADSFKPKYPMKPRLAYYMFYSADIRADLRQLADIDFSETTNFGQTFSNSEFEKIGVVDTRKSSGLNSTFYPMTYLTHIELVKFKTDGSQTLNSPFYCDKLQEVRFDGVIGKTLAMSYCPKLSTDSMKSIISCLKNFTGTGSENTTKISFTAKCWEALEAESTAPGGLTWREYVQTVLCWNV